MTIYAGDLKFLASAVMADVSEGGGPPTANVIPDGQENTIFPDLSDLDRAGGVVNFRKVHLSVQTDTVETYAGANIIIDRPFEDPRVSATLFSTGNVFDTRAQAQSRVESYLNKGAEWAGFLYENHISGQRAIQVFQRVGSELPRAGQTLVLSQNEGLVTAKEQYVRVTKVASVERTFTTSSEKDYKAWVVTLDISDALRYDFTGTSANIFFTRGASAALVRETIVADAGSYLGASPMTAVAHVGDFSVMVNSIYTQLVPSAQTESPLADVSLSQATVGYNPSGGVITSSLTQVFTTTQSLYVGGGIMPGTLSVARGGVTITDKSGKLYNVADEVGLVDYDNGVLTLATNPFGTSAGTHVVTYIPAAAGRIVGGSIGEYVTAENRSLSKVYTLPDIPANYSLSVSYQVNGRWYVLREDGTGAIRGSDSSYGAGTLNYTTGTTTVTFGFLPDVGSAIIYQWLPRGSFYKYTSAWGSDKVCHEIAIPNNGISLSTISIAWTHSGAKTATVNAAGVVSGDATGTAQGSFIRFIPNVIPPKGTVFTVSYDYTSVGETSISLTAGDYTLTDVSTKWRLSFPGATGSLVAGDVTFMVNAPTKLINGVASTPAPRTVKIVFYGGKVYLHEYGQSGPLAEIGTVSTTYIEFNKTALQTYPLYVVTSLTQDVGGVTNGVTASTTSYESASTSVALSADGTHLTVYTGLVKSGTSPSTVSTTYPFTSDELVLFTQMGQGEIGNLKFTFNGETYADNPFDDVLYKGISSLTGVGTAVGTIQPTAGRVLIASWASGAAPAVTNFSAALVPPYLGTSAPYTSSYLVFRTAMSPIRPSSMTISGTTVDGVTFSVTADSNGKFNHSRLKGRINVEAGVAEVYAVAPGDPGAPPTGTPVTWSDSAPRYSVIDLTFLGISGVGKVYGSLLRTATLKYNAVAYSYLPLDASILGIDPVRLPSDGKVTIFRPGGFAVVGHTGSIIGTVSNGQTVGCGRVRLSRVRVVGNNGIVINTGYTTDLENGTVTFTDVTGYSQPVDVQHRIEDMAVVSDAQISGLLSFTRPLTHEYPLGSYVSSALVAGNMFARVSLIFDQATWPGTWLDSLSGSAATATFNNTAYSITVTNRGALTERWIIQFTSSTSFNVIGENVGVIAVGNTSADCSPVNPATGVPYFTIPALGWGTGWITGNIVRFNTIGAIFPVWVVRTVQQGPETVTNDRFAMLARGNINTVMP